MKVQSALEGITWTSLADINLSEQCKLDSPSYPPNVPLGPNSKPVWTWNKPTLETDYLQSTFTALCGSRADNKTTYSPALDCHPLAHSLMEQALCQFHPCSHQFYTVPQSYFGELSDPISSKWVCHWHQRRNV